MLGVVAHSGSTSADATGELSGQVFADTDSDGTFGDADVPMAGFALSISGPTQGCAPACANATSDDTGAFRVANLPPGDYTIRMLTGYMCADPLRTNWLGEYIQGFCTHDPLTAPVTVEAGEETTVPVPLTGLVGHLGGRLWLDGVPRSTGTTITARSGDIVCAGTAAIRRTLNQQVTVTEFNLTFGRACRDSNNISLFAGDRVFAQTTGEEVWHDAIDSWNFADNYFSNHEYRAPEIDPFFAHVDGISGPTSVRALIGDVFCGGATTRGSSAVFGLIVLPEEVRPGCGVLNSPVSFCIGGRLADFTGYWNTSELYFPPTMSPTDTPCPVPVLMGDGNCDGTVTIADAMLGLRSTIEGTGAPCAPEAETDCAGDLGPPNVLPVLRYLAGVPITPTGDCLAVGQPIT